MPRLTCRSMCAVASLVWIVSSAGDLSGQSSSSPYTTKNGEWPSYTGDIRGSRYSPLDQITAQNFNDLEVAWRFKTDSLGTRPEYKLEGTPLMVKGVLYATAGTRRAVIALDAATGELLWVHRYPEGPRGAAAPRQLSGRGLAYWTDGKSEQRILYVTPGYRLIALDAKTGMPVRSFGKDGVVDMKVGVVFGADKPIDLETGEIGLHSTPVVVKDVVLVGSAMKEGMTDHHAQQHEGARPRLRRAHRQGPLDVQPDPQARRARQRHVAREFLGRQRQHGRLDADVGRRGSRARVSAGRVAVVRLLRRQAARRQSVCREPRVRRSRHREAQVALPVRAPSDLGSRHVLGAAPRGCHHQRKAAKARRRAEQAGVVVCLRPRHGRADLADRREAGAEGGRARGVVRADAAAPAGIVDVRPQRAQRRGPHRLHAGAPRAGEETARALQMASGRRLQPADRRQRQRPARRDQHGERQRRHELARRRLRSRHAHRVRPGVDGLDCRRIGRASAAGVLGPPVSGGRRRSAVPAARSGGHGHVRRRAARGGGAGRGGRAGRCVRRRSQDERRFDRRRARRSRRGRGGLTDSGALDRQAAVRRGLRRSISRKAASGGACPTAIRRTPSAAIRCSRA